MLILKQWLLTIFSMVYRYDRLVYLCLSRHLAVQGLPQVPDTSMQKSASFRLLCRGLPGVRPCCCSGLVLWISGAGCTNVSRFFAASRCYQEQVYPTNHSRDDRKSTLAIDTSWIARVLKIQVRKCSTASGVRSFNHDYGSARYKTGTVRVDQ